VTAGRRGSGKALVAMLLAIAIPAFALPMPRIEGLSSYGCAIVQRGDVWEFSGWAEHKLPGGEKDADFQIVSDWKAVLSRRSGKDGRKRAFADCGVWLSEVEKAVEQARMGRSGARSFALEEWK